MNLQKLIEEKYTILNGEIVNFALRIKDETEFVYNVIIQGDGWGCNYGDYDLKHYGAESLMRLMGVLGVNSTSELVGKAVRIAVQDPDQPVKYIGNIIYDKWFNYDETGEVANVIDLDTGQATEEVVEEEPDPVGLDQYTEDE